MDQHSAGHSIPHGDATAWEQREEQLKEEIGRLREERMIYASLQALTGNFICVYIVDPESGAYREFSSTEDYTLNFEQAREGKDFFSFVQREAPLHTHPEDLNRLRSAIDKEKILAEIEKSGVFSLVYRMMMDGKPLYVQFSAFMLKEDGKPRMIVAVNNIDEAEQKRLAEKADRRKSVSYTQIAERLASHFDLIYYIPCKKPYYTEFSIRKKSGALKVREEAEDFFKACQKSIDKQIHPEDRERLRLFLDRDHLITELEDRRQLSLDYRMFAGEDLTQYTRMSVTYSSDHSHFIICIENRDDDVRKEQEQLAALNLANQMARRDGLTHVKNKTAYHEMEKELQQQIEDDTASFSILVCDINDLKNVNDTEGHKAGDEYIRSACMMVCRVFQHSPVYRIGGDEFAVVLRDEDFQHRAGLTAGLRDQVEENIRTGQGPVVASGLADYQRGRDHSPEDVFVRSDSEMYENKKHLREIKMLVESHSLMEQAAVRLISGERRNMLDALYRSFEVVSEGTYVFLCDMRYDYSRWSKNAVDTYGLPSEYMYGAGRIWEEHIHPEDREAYHKGIDEIFAGISAEHDMQYRVLRTDGAYDVCTCRGVVIRDASGEPDYFAGAIRNHGPQGQIDPLTGLRNQYGFFEDLDTWIRRNTSISVILFSISRFSEINEMYGYHFGNRVLQHYARKVYETTGNEGHSYRIDGTKFAVISNTLSIREMQDKYRGFREFLHDGFAVEGQKIMLDTNCGSLRVDSFDINSQIVYACLNFACEESKNLRKGDMVEFRNELNRKKHQRLEMLHEIKSSIKRGYEGFFLCYQPIVDAKTEKMVGAEVLLRWKNRRYGVVYPDQFIPVLEIDPLFPELGEWILREAVLACRPILKQNPEFVLNVNLSYAQLERPEFASRVTGILEELDYPPEHLCLEVTERCRLIDLEMLKRVIHDLRARGFLTAMDDFGTGFSSVGILREIPFDVIKIDRSFISEIEKNETQRKLIEIIASLASVFKAQVCVEGVETAAARDILRSFHADHFQGYLYARPLPIEELTRWRRD